MSHDLAALEERLRAFALDFPETHEDFPWGERALKVRKKVFVFMHRDEQRLAMSVKLPYSRDEALDLPGAEPTHYGLGKHGWVSLRIVPDSPATADQLEAFIDESFAAVAPATVLRALRADG